MQKTYIAIHSAFYQHIGTMNILYGVWRDPLTQDEITKRCGLAELTLAFNYLVPPDYYTD